MKSVKDFFSTVVSMLIALIRLFALTICFVASGIQIILFTRTEICNVEMRGQPLRCDKDEMDEKLSYVDKLMLENPDLLGLPEREDDSPLTEEDMRALEDIMNDEDDDDNDIGM